MIDYCKPPVIYCAKCGKPVDRSCVMYNERLMHREFRVWCHGEEDTCIIDDLFMVELGGPLVNGVAFKVERVEHVLRVEDKSDRT